MGSLGQILNEGVRKERWERAKSESTTALNLLSKLIQLVSSPLSVHFLLALTSESRTCRREQQEHLASATCLYLGWSLAADICTLCLKGAFPQKVAKALNCYKTLVMGLIRKLLALGLPLSKYSPSHIYMYQKKYHKDFRKGEGFVCTRVVFARKSFFF